MHVQDGYAAVHDVHAVEGGDVGDGSAAAGIDLAQLSGLEDNAAVIHDAADPAEVLGVGIVGAGFSAGAGELVEDQAVAQECGVLLLKDAGVERIEARADIRGKHAAGAQAAAQCKLAVLAGAVHQLRRCVLEESGLHAGRADAADLFLVDKQAAGGVLGRAGLQDGFQGGEGADAVIMSVGSDHAAVKAAVAGGPGGNDLELGGEEIILIDAVGILQQAEEILPDGILGLLGLFAFFRIRAQRAAAHQHVEALAFDDDAALLGQLVRGKVDEQVGDAEDRIRRILTDHDRNDRAVLFGDDAVDGERDGHPLIFLDSAVIVRIQIGKLGILVGRDLLDVQARRIDVGAEDAHALFKRLLAEDEERNGLVHVDGVDLIARAERFPCGNHFLQVAVSGFLRKADRLGGALALGLAGGQEFGVARAERFQVPDLGITVLVPCVFFCHFEILQSIDPASAGGKALRRESAFALWRRAVLL